jgi:hypothetical protein
MLDNGGLAQPAWSYDKQRPTLALVCIVEEPFQRPQHFVTLCSPGGSSQNSIG